MNIGTIEASNRSNEYKGDVFIGLGSGGPQQVVHMVRKNYEKNYSRGFLYLRADTIKKIV